MRQKGTRKRKIKISGEEKLNKLERLLEEEKKKNRDRKAKERIQGRF